MARSTYFVQECPTCGRSLQVPVEYLGRRMVCQHCHGRFEAHDPSSAAPTESNSGIDLIQRADKLLGPAAQVRAQRAI